jgi:hypothetical protein
MGDILNMYYKHIPHNLKLSFYSKIRSEPFLSEHVKFGTIFCDLNL